MFLPVIHLEEISDVTHVDAMLQVIASLLSNWGQHWFTHFPHPPLPVLGQLEELLAFHDPGLFQAMSSGQSVSQQTVKLITFTAMHCWHTKKKTSSLQSRNKRNYQVYGTQKVCHCTSSWYSLNSAHCMANATLSKVQYLRRSQLMHVCSMQSWLSSLHTVQTQPLYAGSPQLCRLCADNA